MTIPLKIIPTKDYFRIIPTFIGIRPKCSGDLNIRWDYCCQFFLRLILVFTK